MINKYIKVQLKLRASQFPITLNPVVGGDLFILHYVQIYQANVVTTVLF